MNQNLKQLAEDTFSHRLPAPKTITNNSLQKDGNHEERYIVSIDELEFFIEGLILSSARALTEQGYSEAAELLKTIWTE